MSEFRSMPMFWEAFFADTEALAEDEAKAHLFLIGHAWIRGARLPADDGVLARLARLSPRKWAAIKGAVMALWKLDGDGFWTQKRLTKEYDFVRTRVEVSRRNGANGGRPKSDKKRNEINETGNLGLCSSISKTNLSTRTLTEEGSNEPSCDPSVARATSGLSTGDAVDLFGIDKIPKAKDADAKGELLAFGSAWNDMAAKFKLAAIDFIRPGTPRERHALARLRELHKDYSSDGDTLVGKVRGSPYLRGEINGFRCTFDWMINPQNFQKIMEGNYEGSTKDHKERHQGYR